MKLTKEMLWTIIRVQIFFEFSRFYFWGCRIIDRQEKSDENKEARKGNKRNEIIEAVEFIKHLPAPNSKLEECGIKHTSANHYLFEVFQEEMIGKYLFRFLPAGTHFGYRSEDDGIVLYSERENVARIGNDGRVHCFRTKLGGHFKLFLNSVFDGAIIPTQESFDAMDISLTLDSIAQAKVS